MSTRPGSWLLMLVAAVVLCAPPGVDASVRLVSDAVLAESSLAAVHGTIVALESRWDGDAETIYTYVTVNVVQAWGRADVPSRIVVKALGGRVGDTELHVGGQATFTVGEEVVMFLDVRPRDGTLYVTGFEQGKWTVQRGVTMAAPAAVRERHAASFQPPTQPERRSLAEIAQLAARVGRAGNLAFVAVPPELSRPRAAAPAWTYASPAAPARWHEADVGQTVFVDFQSGGQPQLADGGIPQLAGAIAMWRQAGPLPIELGVSRGPRCVGSPQDDRRISVSYNDPCDEIGPNDPTLAYAYYYASSADTRVVNGVAFRGIYTAMVIMNEDMGRFQGFSVGCYEQLLAHELGHAIGFGHSSSSGAIMDPTIGGCQDRTTSNPLSSDELAGLAAIYPSPAWSVPSAPRNVTATVTARTITASWEVPAQGRVDDYVVEVGSTPGARDMYVFSNGLQTSVSASVGPGQYFIRVLARNSTGVGPASAEVSAIVADPAPALPPAGLGGLATGSTVGLEWTPPPGPSPHGYVLEAGSASGLANLLVTPVAGTAFVAGGIGPGVYYVRVRAVGGSGVSTPSPDITVIVGAAGPPGAPGGLGAIVSAGRTVTLSWMPPAGAAASGYVLEAGTAPGLANVVVVPLGPTASVATTGVPPGVYYVRVRASTPTGLSPASNEIVVPVP